MWNLFYVQLRFQVLLPISTPDYNKSVSDDSFNNWQHKNIIDIIHVL